MTFNKKSDSNKAVAVSRGVGNQPASHSAQLNVITVERKNQGKSKIVDLSNINPLTERGDIDKYETEQENFFEKSKIRDDNGNLLVVYHGTDEDFTVFDKTKGRSTIDVTGYRRVIEQKEVVHILKRHGKNGKADSSMTNDEDIASIPYVLDNYDVMHEGDRTNAYSTWENGRNKTAKTIIYEKVLVDKSHYVIEAVPETSSKTLYVISTFIGVRDYKKKFRASSMLKNSPEETSEMSDAITSINNIPSSDESVNPEPFSSRRDVGYEAEQTLNNATEEEIKQIVDAVDRELFGDAMGYGRMLGEQKRKADSAK